MNEKVKILLRVGGNQLVAHPVFGDDLCLKISREDNQVFNRAKMDGTLRFVGGDFDFVASASHNTLFTLEVLVGSVSLGTASFYKSDCDLDYDGKCCTIKMQTTDKYEKFLAALDNKYNLVRLAPEVQSLSLNKRAVLQFYMRGDDKLTNYLGNMAFEADTINDAPSKTDYQLTNNLKFTKIYNYSKVTIGFDSVALAQFDNADAIAASAGTYKASFSGSSPSILTREDGRYTIKPVTGPVSGMSILTIFDSNNIISAREDVGGGQYNYFDIDIDGLSFSGSSQGSIELFDDGQMSYGVIGDASETTKTMYCRMLSDQTAYGENPTLISSLNNDIMEDSHNYLYVAGVTWLSLTSRVIMSTEKTLTPTPYYDGNGEYYVEPEVQTAGNRVFPIGESTWGEMSFWFESSVLLFTQIDSSANVRYTLPDAYPIHSAIERLLEQIDPTLSFHPTAEYSAFLYEEDLDLQAYLPTPMVRDGGGLYITPITNIKKTRYEQAAQRGDITLKQILDMLRKVYQCYWFIDGDNRLRIEHISYFKGGKDYILGYPPVDVDITAMKDLPNGLKWSFGTDKLGYDTKLCPSRYEFEWADACTEQFNGEPIDIKDGYIEGGSTEKISVANFTSDIDYTILSPNSVSDDIYALLEANNLRRVQITRVRHGSEGPWYAMQNGYCSFLYVEQNYWPYDLGGWSAVFGGQVLPVLDTKRFANQDINFPIDLSAMPADEVLTIRTGLGAGSVESMEVGAETEYAKAKIRLSAQRDYSDSVEMTSVGSASYKTYTIANNSEVPLEVAVAVTDLGMTHSRVQKYIVEPRSTEQFGVTAGYATLLSAERVGDFIVGELITSYPHAMSLSVNLMAHDSASFAFEGGFLDEKMWGYAAVKCNERVTITLESSSERGDLGYVGERPYTDELAIQAHALAWVEGVEDEHSTAQVTIEAGEVVYIGYSKRGYGIDGDDLVQFSVELA